MSKKVAMFSVHSDPLASLGAQESGGQNAYIRYLAEELGKLGWQVDVFTRWDTAYKKRITNISQNVRVIRLRGGPVSFIKKTELFDYLPEIFNDFLLFTKNENPYQIFHGHYWDGGQVAVMAGKKFNAPVAQNFHSLGFTRMETVKKFREEGKEKDYFIKRLNVENEIIKSASVIISLAEAGKQDLTDFYGCPPEKIKVIPGGVNLKNWPLVEKHRAREYLRVDQKEFVVLYVGRLEWGKGISTLLRAGGILRKEIPSLKIFIIGGKIFGRQKNSEDAKEYERLREISKSEKIHDFTSFIGKIDHRYLSHFFRMSDVLVVPSYYEGFGLVVLEGMANKIPVVASGTGGLAQIIKDKKNGLLFEPRNAVALKEKILSLYKNSEFSQKIAESGYESVRANYSWRTIAEKISQIYENCILLFKPDSVSSPT